MNIPIAPGVAPETGSLIAINGNGEAVLANAGDTVVGVVYAVHGDAVFVKYTGSAQDVLRPLGSLIRVAPSDAVRIRTLPMLDAIDLCVTELLSLRCTVTLQWAFDESSTHMAEDTADALTEMGFIGDEDLGLRGGFTKEYPLLEYADKVVDRNKHAEFGRWSHIHALRVFFGISMETVFYRTSDRSDFVACNCERIVFRSASASVPVEASTLLVRNVSEKWTREWYVQCEVYESIRKHVSVSYDAKKLVDNVHALEGQLITSGVIGIYAECDFEDSTGTKTFSTMHISYAMNTSPDAPADIEQLINTSKSETLLGYAGSNNMQRLCAHLKRHFSQLERISEVLIRDKNTSYVLTFFPERIR